MYQKIGKRLLDIIASATALILLSPLMFMAGMEDKEKSWQPGNLFTNKAGQE